VQPDSAQSSRQAPPRRRTGAYARAVVALWAVGTAYAFWTFELEHQRSFETRRTVLFDSGARARSAEDWFQATVAPALARSDAAVATVVHVYSPGCPCNRYTHPHLARIMARYQTQGVRFIAATRVADASAGPDGLVRVSLAGANSLAWIEATPAALVFDARGQLVYFGPYSDSGRCGDSGGLVEKVLDRLSGGQSPRPQPFYGGGCFCGTDGGAAESTI
jgi:Domain of unknown function (DUF6436)